MGGGVQIQVHVNLTKAHSLSTLADQMLRDVKHAEMCSDQLQKVPKSCHFNPTCMETPFSQAFTKKVGYIP